jgi:hypothetical protein
VNIRDEPVEACEETRGVSEEVGGRHADDPPSLGLKKLPTLDVEPPLPSIHPMPVALVLEGDASSRDAEIGMEGQPPAVDGHGIIDLESVEAVRLEKEPQERLRSRVGTEADARERPGPRAGSSGSVQFFGQLPEFTHLQQCPASACPDEVIAGRDQVFPTDHARELAPDVSGSADGDAIEDLTRDAPEAVTDHAAPPRRGAGKRYRDVQGIRRRPVGKRDTQECRRCLMAEVAFLGHQRKISPAEFLNTGRRDGQMHRVKRMVEIGSAET